MGSGSERNKRCWCGSGLKIKKCHANREGQPPKKPGQAFAELRSHFTKKYCLAPDAPAGCSGKIAKAHTVQRAGALEAIAEDSHVYQMSVAPAVLARTGGLPEPKLVGINRGSTFTGFCQFHDSSLFRALETAPFEGTPEQCRLLTYRAACRELFQKMSAASAEDLLRQVDAGRTPSQQWLIQNLIGGVIAGTTAGLAGMVAHKKRMDAILRTAHRPSPGAAILRLSSVPDVMCAGGIYPDEDVGGGELQDLGDVHASMSFMAFSMFLSGNTGFAVFSWEEDSATVSRAFVHSLLAQPRHTWSNYLVLFAFEYLENTLFRPGWWRGLSERARSRLQKATMSGSPVTWNAGQRLADLPLDVADWEVQEVTWLEAGASVTPGSAGQGRE